MGGGREAVKVLKQDILDVRRAFEDLSQPGPLAPGHECSERCIARPSDVFGPALEERLKAHQASCEDLHQYWELALCSLLQTSLSRMQQHRQLQVRPAIVPTPPPGSKKSYSRGAIVRIENKASHPFGASSFSFKSGGAPPHPPHPPPAAQPRRGSGELGPPGKAHPRSCSLSALVRVLGELESLWRALTLGNRRLEESQKQIIELKLNNARAEFERPGAVDDQLTINNLSLEVERLETSLSQALDEVEETRRAKEGLEGKYQVLRDIADQQYMRELVDYQSKVARLEREAESREEELGAALARAKGRAEEAERVAAEWRPRAEASKREAEDASRAAEGLRAQLGQLQQSGGVASEEICKLQFQLQEANDAKLAMEVRIRELDENIEVLKGRSTAKADEDQHLAIADARLARMQAELEEANRRIAELTARVKHLEGEKRQGAEEAVKAAQQQAKIQKDMDKETRRKRESERARLKRRAEERAAAKRAVAEATKAKEEEQKKRAREEEKKRRQAAHAEAIKARARAEAAAEEQKARQAALEQEVEAARLEREKLQKERAMKEKKEKKEKKKKDRSKGSRKVEEGHETHAPPPPPKKTQSGYGKCIYGPGEWYEGYWELYERHGQGVYHWADGRRYEGSWCRDKKHGKGSYFWSDGDRYEGDYADDKMHGEGTYFFADGTRYEGEWAADMSHGKGIFWYFDGAKFEGSFDQDRKHGQGVMQHVNGDVYQEMWDFGRCVSSVKLKPNKSRSKKK